MAGFALLLVAPLGGAGLASAHQPPSRPTVITMAAQQSSVVVGATVELTGSIAPAARRPIRLQLAGSSGWRNVEIDYPTARGTFSFSYPVRSPVTELSFRARAAAAKVGGKRLPAVIGPVVVVSVRDLGDTVIGAVNQARASDRWCGTEFFEATGGLTEHPLLTITADKYAERMATEDFFSHTSPEGQSPSDRAAAEGYEGGVGEVIAAGGFTATSVVRRWLDSPGHCAVLMGRGTDIGVGYAYDADSSYGGYWVVLAG